MKKIFLLLGILLSMVETWAQQHILLQFSSQDKVPAINFNEASKSFQLNTTDPQLTHIFSSFTITKFTKEFPHAYLVKHRNAEPLDRVYRIETSADISKLFAQLLALSSPAFGGAIYLLDPPQIMALPNDYSLFCGMPCGLPGCASGLQNDLINAPAAWNITTGDSSIRIAVTDANFRRTHEELNGKIVNDYAAPFVPGNNHGSLVASIAAGKTNNGVGISSIGYNCKLDLYDIGYDAILQAAINGARVINCSWHDGSCAYTSYAQDMIDMIYETYHPVIVAAAGNGNSSGCGLTGDTYPASYNHVISVSSVGHLSEIGSCSYGWKDVHDYIPGSPSSSFTHNSMVDLCAPGVRIIGASGVNDNHYAPGFGTSFAAPMVAGTAALILSVNPLLGPNDVEAILKSTARDVYEISHNIPYLNQLGSGRIDAGLAVQLAQSWVPGSGTQQAAPSNIRWFNILTDGINNIEIEDNCNSTNTYPGMCNIGYRLEVVGNPGAGFKWLVFYSQNGTNVSNSIRTGSSITLTRGIDYPSDNVNGGNLKVAVRVNDGVPGSYYAEDRGSGCLGLQCNNSCPSDITITGNYATPLTESATWVKSSGQTTIEARTSVKLDASPVNGYIEMVPVSEADYFVAWPDATGVFMAEAYNGCISGSPASAAGQNTNATNKKKGKLTDSTGITIYPNPGRGLFFVKHPANIKQMVIADTQGKLILKIENLGSTLTKIDLTGMPSGIYMLRMEGVNKSMKIIKQ